MRIYYDTEFLEDGKTIELISIGMIREDGKEYYAVNNDAPWKRITEHEWLMKNVVPSLPVLSHYFSWHYGNITLDHKNSLLRPRWLIANEVRDFITGTPDPELWAWYGSYDHVVLSQLWGRMTDHPEGVPLWTNDLKQEFERLGKPEISEQASGEHNAIEDARHNRVVGEDLKYLARSIASE